MILASEMQFPDVSAKLKAAAADASGASARFDAFLVNSQLTGAKTANDVLTVFDTWKGSRGFTFVNLSTAVHVMCKRIADGSGRLESTELAAFMADVHVLLSALVAGKSVDVLGTVAMVTGVGRIGQCAPDLGALLCGLLVRFAPQLTAQVRAMCSNGLCEAEIAAFKCSFVCRLLVLLTICVYDEYDRVRAATRILLPRCRECQRNTACGCQPCAGCAAAQRYNSPEEVRIQEPRVVHTGNCLCSC